MRIATLLAMAMFGSVAIGANASPLYWRTAGDWDTSSNLFNPVNSGIGNTTWSPNDGTVSMVNSTIVSTRNLVGDGSNVVRALGVTNSLGLTLASGTLELGSGGWTQNGTNTATIGTDGIVKLMANQIWDLSVTGNSRLVIAAAGTLNTNGQNLELKGLSTNLNAFVFDGAITGNGKITVNMEGAGSTATFKGNIDRTWTGDLEVLRGVAAGVTGGDKQIFKGNVIIGGGAHAATFALGANTNVFGSAAEITLKSNGTLNLTQSNSATPSGIARTAKVAAFTYDGGTIATTLNSRLMIGSDAIPGSGTGLFLSTGGTYTVNAASGAPLLQSFTGGTLSGIGTVNQSLVVPTLGKIAPGNSAGTLSLIGNLGIDGTYDYEANDLLAIDGDLALGGTSILELLDALNPSLTYTIATFTGSLSGTFGTVDSDILLTHNIAYNSNNIQLVAIPEPASLVLMGIGSLMILSRRRVD